MDEGLENEKLIQEQRRDFEQCKAENAELKAQIKLMTDEMAQLTRAAVEGRLDTRGDVSKFSGDFANVIQGMNDTLDAIVDPLNECSVVLEQMAVNDYTVKVSKEYQGDYAKLSNNLNEVLGKLNIMMDVIVKITDGDLSYLPTYRKIGKRSENDKLIPSFVKLMENIQALSEDANMLADAGVNGRLDIRADASRHQGVYAGVIEGMNETLDAVVGPLNVAAEYIDRISKGDVPAKITDDYKGDFNEIKNNLNQCIDGLGGLVESNAVLQRMAVNDYTTKVEGKYLGLYADVANATNTVSGRMLHVIDVIQNISKGDMSDLDELKGVGQRSENDRLVPSLTIMVESIHAIVDDAEMLADAGVNGRLDVRADISRHEGAYSGVIQGFNDTLDAVVGPLNVAAEYIDRISKGDVPAKITDDYKGDFNEIKNNLNQCIDGLGGLVESNAVLQRMAENDYTTKVEGKYLGLYADVANATNLVTDRMLHVLDIVHNIAMGDGSDLDGLKKVGRRSDNDRLIPSLIAMIESIKAIVDDAELLADAGINGHLDVRADVSKHQGAFAGVIEGLNNILDAIVKPINEAMRVSQIYAGKDFAARVDESVKFAGDFIRFKEALNNIGIEIGKAMMNVNSTVFNVGNSIKDVNKGVEEIGKTIEQVAVNSQQFAEDSKKQMDSIEEVGKEISDLSASIEEIASTSEEVKSATEEVSRLGDEASSLGNEANNKMKVVEGHSKESVDDINTLNSKMLEISNIVKLITNISNQTNLLALNAAIEAARAGEHGRGFAVVAGEVRNLAGESKQATDNIEHLILDIQADSARTAESMTSAYNEIQTGITSVNQVIEALNKMASGAAKAAEGVNEIAKATEEQANATNRVMESMETTTRLTKENLRRIEEQAAMTEEVSASTEEVGSGAAEVTNMAGDLGDLVKTFKVD